MNQFTLMSQLPSFQFIKFNNSRYHKSPLELHKNTTVSIIFINKIYSASICQYSKNKSNSYNCGVYIIYYMFKIMKESNSNKKFNPDGFRGMFVL
ncbi:Hypothetical protein CINCED_3A013706 [Cinara cedri]|uniref:Ubiquitin-like protease family profile domain-containing protein n=1 Tax=Cinara cedri TaxID=506608 RepID=A0A5E4MQH5_9HEMI|nr:Hypothetical protein CINCED_3A013706 [Cinara cedri]